MQPETPPPAEAVLIRRARSAVIPHFTAEAAAAQARASGGKISAPYWRCVETGYGGRRGKRVPMRASDETLALMAATVTAAGIPVTPRQLEDAGRAGAAAVLRAAAARRLGDLLIEHRLADGWHARDVFCAARGISAALARDVENGQRATLSADDTAVISRAYQVTQASAAAVFAGEATALESLPEADQDEAAVWAEVKRHPPGTPGEVIFPSGTPGVITDDARNWNALAGAKVPISELVPMIAWWRRRNRQDAGGTDRWEVPRPRAEAEVAAAGNG